MIAGMPQQMIDMGPNWTDIISCLAAVVAIIVPIAIWRMRRNKKG